MHTASLLIALLLVAAVALAYRRLRRNQDPGDSAPEHFFGGVDEETQLPERRPPADRP